jgi:hypothetical protein
MLVHTAKIFKRRKTTHNRKITLKNFNKKEFMTALKHADMGRHTPLSGLKSGVHV